VTNIVKPAWLTTHVYVDGFNLYYRAMKHGRFGDFRWLDIVRFCRVLLPHNHVTLVRYFTADLHPLKWDPAPADRQRVYLRALRSLPDLAVRKGRFAVRQIVRPQVKPTQPIAEPSSMVRVWNLEEEGSDVNLASYLLRDGFLGEYDAAVVISDDSDLVEPIRIVRRDIGKPVGIVQLRPKSAFAAEGDFRIHPRRWHFERSQLPLELRAPDGGIVRKPPEWS